MITTCPLNVKADPVGKTVRPVTHEALVAVNSASMKEMPLTVIRGSMSSRVPKAIRMRNDMIISTGGDRLRRVSTVLALESSISTMHKK